MVGLSVSWSMWRVMVEGCLSRLVAFVAFVALRMSLMMRRKEGMVASFYTCSTLHNCGIRNTLTARGTRVCHLGRSRCKP
ncbi:hypothetical protein BKA57DRAFT_456526 [Linnemannia elongata]|nr:hypothetical protein BKA57DRAFT_456526 [Linnemannia elongata]